MRVRSTGLGNTEMVARIDAIKRLDGHLLMTMVSIEPVRWRIRIALNYRDILRIVRVGVFSILIYLITGLGTIFRSPPAPTNY
jgi:hypothetical protein